jgi:uncharacterized protein YndB with AHSA1/START domain
MTRQQSFKRIVRTRMEKTGESYTAARTALLAGGEDRSNGKPATVDAPTLTVSDDVIRRRTGHGWEHWFDVLDEWGAVDQKHREIARWLNAEHGVPGWDAQSITVSYERARGLRAVGEKADGFSITASKTVAVPVERLFDAFVEESLREQWLPGVEMRERTSTRPRGARFDWGDGSTRLVVGFESKGEAKSLAALMHEKLPDAEEAQRMKAYWRERVGVLKQVLEA